ncbi:radical SAM family heme chaperone HemW [Persicobacter diffluens]
MAGIYIHIPFCKQACYYCDFHFSTSGKLREEMVASIILELSLRREYLETETVETIYFGGGTPSLLSPEELSQIIEAIYKNFTLIPQPEITLEANPDDLSFTYLKGLHQIGINRLSIGIQSFFEKDLKLLHRAHDREQAFNAVENARKAGFNNLNLDLIYAMPQSSNEEWEENLALMMKLRPAHLSAYALTIEEKTVFGNWYRKGKIRPVDEDKAADQLEILIKTTANHGYEHYEVSNFCLPGLESKHNSSYWLQKKYLGIGPGAHSYNHQERHFNIANNAKYVKAIKEGQLPLDGEVLSREDLINEYIMTRLRTKWGCDLGHLQNHLNFDLTKEHGAYLQKLEKDHFLEKQGDVLFLTSKGKMIADQITEHLFFM